MLRLNGLDFHVEVAGDGPPLLLLHGFTGSVRTWDALRAALDPTTRAIAMDLIGHGHSAAPPDPERYTLDLAANDLTALLDTLGLASLTVLGYSMGGRVALHFAVTHPDRVRGLILEGASPGIEDGVEREHRGKGDDALAERILRGGIPAFVEDWERQPLLTLADHVPETVRAAQHAQRLLNRPLGLANSLRGMSAGRQTPLWSRLGALRMPVSLIVGERDTRYREIAGRMKGLVPHAEINVVEAAGHTVHVDQPFEFARLVAGTFASGRRRQTAHFQQIDTTRHTLLY